jgi:hypothetical protein
MSDRRRLQAVLTYMILWLVLAEVKIRTQCQILGLIGTTQPHVVPGLFPTSSSQATARTSSVIEVTLSSEVGVLW